MFTKKKDCSHNIGSGSGDGLKGTLVGGTERNFLFEWRELTRFYMYSEWKQHAASDPQYQMR